MPHESMGMLKKKMISGVAGKGEKVDRVMEGEEGDHQTVLSVEKYPELEGIEVGAEVKGSWSGKVSDVSDGQVTIDYSELEIETENAADQALSTLKGEKSKPATEEDDGDAY